MTATSQVSLKTVFTLTPHRAEPRSREEARSARFSPFTERSAGREGTTRININRGARLALRPLGTAVGRILDGEPAGRRAGNRGAVLALLAKHQRPDHREVEQVEGDAGREGGRVEAEVIVQDAGQPAARRHAGAAAEQQGGGPPSRPRAPGRTRGWPAHRPG